MVRTADNADVLLFLIAVMPEWKQLNRLPASAFTGEITVRYKQKPRFDLPSSKVQPHRVSVRHRFDRDVRVRVEGHSTEDLFDLMDKLHTQDDVELVFPTLKAFDAASSSYVADQQYRDASPTGVDADAAAVNGHALGKGVRVGSVEGGWNLWHEDLPSCDDVGTYQSSNNDHGTAVLGIVFGQPNGFGVTGIAHQASCAVSSWSTSATAQDAGLAIRRHVAQMSAGDVLFISGQLPGPNWTGVAGDQTGFVPLDYDPTYCSTIKDATDKGVIVVLAAGNGGEDLDRDEFSYYRVRSRADGAIIVGAGSAPGWLTAGRARMSFSTYGSRVDVQGLGEQVTTTGYGDVDPDQTNPDYFYTSQFAGTSSATPVVAGVIASLQSYQKYLGRAPLTPAQMRQLLINTGAPQTGDTSEHIGPYPDLRAALQSLQDAAPPPADAPAPTGPTGVEPLINAPDPVSDVPTVMDPPRNKPKSAPSNNPVPMPTSEPEPAATPKQGCQQSGAPLLSVLLLYYVYRLGRERHARARRVH